MSAEQHLEESISDWPALTGEVKSYAARGQYTTREEVVADLRARIIDHSSLFPAVHTESTTRHALQVATQDLAEQLADEVVEGWAGYRGWQEERVEP